MSTTESTTSATTAGPSAPKCPRTSSDAPRPTLPMNFYRLVKLIDDEDQLISFCQEHGLLPRYVFCPTCKSRLDKYVKGKDGCHSFVCHKRKCRKASTQNRVSLRKGTWFEGAKISMQKSLVLIYCFVENLSQRHAIVQSSLHNLTSIETVVDYFNYCREVCVDSLYSDGEAKQIGGPSCTVEIEEAKFGKRKYSQGQIVEGQWVLGGVCRETKECFLVPVDDRTEETLIGTIKRHVRQGTIIHMDCSDFYKRLEAEGYKHLTVKHPQKFVDPEAGACTNTIESTWWAVRRALPSNCIRSKYFASYLAEYIWRKMHRDGDVFMSFLHDISQAYPVQYDLEVPTVPLSQKQSLNKDSICPS